MTLSPGFSTIDGVFGKIQQAIETEDYYSVKYDFIYGYPREFAWGTYRYTDPSPPLR